MQKTILKTDLIIFGGGVAGLWALNRLKQLGFQTILLETHALGAGQTLKSQGIIHGGIKYALTGFLNRAANAVANMPSRWQACLQGSGEINLQTVNVLSPYQLLWSTGSLSSGIGSFLASKALKSRVQKLQPSEYPVLLQHAQFKGHVYRLEELVIDVHSLIKALAAPHYNHIFKIDPEGYEFIFEPNNPQNILALDINTKHQKVSLQAKRYLMMAGEGNEALITRLAQTAPMQRRALHMVLVKLNDTLSFFGHCIDQGKNPRITITSHPTQEGKTIWYIGGQIAEDGIHRTSAEQIEQAKKELAMLFPWLDLSTAQWASFFVNRAESKQLNGKRPEHAFVKTLGNTLLTWPTKLALAPVLTDDIVKTLQQQEIKPTLEPNETLLTSLLLEHPTIATPPWEMLFD